MAASAKEVSGETTMVEAPAVQSLSSPNTDNTNNNSEFNGVKDSSDSIANAKSVKSESIMSKQDIFPNHVDHIFSAISPFPFISSSSFSFFFG
ncbi:hypothetical protein H5410_042619 [Solanum commersonii]|uniref:Uncharacterized protein n=1 Tax=Solanum commersonii TaxID=4109 RepID=A0A9J5XV85_SOLCO|nr:hypothetical protein H5410_042619 [Solanum commersonii]